MNRKNEPHQSCGPAGGAASSSPATSIDDLRERVERLEAILRNAGLESRLAENGVDGTAYNRAIRELARGNRKPLERYLQRGGKIPTAATG